MTPNQFFSVLRARFGLVLLVFVLLFGAALAAGVLRAKEYTAVASVLVDFGPDPVSVRSGAGMSLPDTMATQAEMIHSERVARRVIGTLALQSRQAIRERWQEETAAAVPLEDWLVPRLQEKLDVRPAREGGVLAVSFRAADAAWAAEVANAFVNAYLDVALEVRTEAARRSHAFFEQRSQEVRSRLEQAQARLSAFQAANGIVATDEKLDIETARLNELSSRHTEALALVGESTTRQAQAQGLRADRLQEVVAHPLITQLRTEVGRAEADLQQLDTRLGENHPQVTAARATVAELRRRLTAETRRIGGSVGLSHALNQQREADLRAAVEQQRQRVLQMRTARSEGLVIVRDVESAKRAYDALLQRMGQAQLESVATQAAASVLSRATAPIEASSPRLLVHGALGLLLGALVAVGVALALELRDRRVRTPLDLIEASGLVLLGTMAGRGGVELATRPPLVALRRAAPTPNGA